MSEDNKQRLNEIELALSLNHLDKCEDKIQYNVLIKILSSLIAALGKEEHDIFVMLFQKSIGDGLLGATNKELVYTQRKRYSIKEFAKKFNKANYWYTYTYKDLIYREFENKEFLDNLKPKYADNSQIFVVNFILKFIKNFKYALGSESVLDNHERSLEIEFYLIYTKILGIIQNVGVTDKFIYNVCNLLDIDYNTIAHLKNNLHIIDRSYPNFKYNKRYFMQEICTLYTSKGLSKGTIGSKVLDKSTNFFYNNTNKEYGKVIQESDMDWQYIPTLDWTNLDKGAVMKFINVFHSFISYEL